MAANTRYETAPQRDSLDDQSFTQSPPSYQAAESSYAPRTEGDNVPDDFKVRKESLLNYPRRSVLTVYRQFGGTVAEATLPIRMQFVRKVYSIL